MLKIKHNYDKHMSSDGAQVLRVMQNDNTPLIDLVVRESIQNSLDASLPNKDVFVNYSIKEFQNRLFLENLEGVHIRDNDIHKSLIISDHNTEGLTGSFSYQDENRGNILKLAYNIGKPQEKEGSGGSWGYGKTIYFRIGNGLVIYYSRIKKENGQGYEERLVASLVEDNRGKKETFLNYDDNRQTGIVWWGELDKNDESIPTIDENKISKIMASLNVERFSGEETGTKIIIPYINVEQLFDQAISYTISNGQEENGVNESIFIDFYDYLKNSIQRWYAPRLNNPYYQHGNKNNLKVSINSNLIEERDQDKIYKLIRSMYNYAVTREDADFKKLNINSELILEDIRINKPSERDYIKDNKIGTFVYGKFNFADLNLDPNNDIYSRYNAYNYLLYNNDFEDENVPIIIYTRQPGMVINYRNQGDWSLNNTIKTPKDEYILGFFVLNSELNAHILVQNGPFTYEEYFRESENADHFSWKDNSILLENGKHHSFGFIRRITNNIKSKVRTKFSANTNKKRTNVSEYLGSFLGKQIMPPTGYGESARNIISKTPNTKEPKTIKTKVQNFSSKLFHNNMSFIDKNIINIPFEILMDKEGEFDFFVDLSLSTSGRNISIDKYEKDTSLKSPIGISNIKFDESINLINKKKYESEKFKTNIGYKFTYYNKDRLKINGKIELYFEDQLFSPVINIKEGDV